MASEMPRQFNQRAVEQSVRNGTPIKIKGGASPSVDRCIWLRESANLAGDLSKDLRRAVDGFKKPFPEGSSVDRSDAKPHLGGDSHPASRIKNRCLLKAISPVPENA
jgi:hypothetical protein